MKLKQRNILLLALSTVLLAGCGNSGVAIEKNSTKAVSTEEVVESTPLATEDTVTYPITIEHAFGETVIESKPENVVTISWGNQDVPLALGVVPAGMSKANYGQVDEKGLLPWTAEKYKALGVESPVVFDDTDGLNYEAMSDVQPDVILAAYSGITEEEYKLLSEIAPVVAYPTFAWQTYWREQTLMDATGMGMQAEGEALVAEIEKLIEEKKAEHGDLEGKTAAFFYFNPADLGTFYIYMPTDPRAAYLVDLGLAFPESVVELAGDTESFTVELSAEHIDILTDIDVIVTYGDATVLEALKADQLVGKIPAIANGSVAMIDDNSYIAAACTPSVLSIPATIDEYLDVLSEAAAKVK